MNKEVNKSTSKHMDANNFNEKNILYCMWPHVLKVSWRIGLGKRSGEKKLTPTKNEMNPYKNLSH